MSIADGGQRQDFRIGYCEALGMLVFLASHSTLHRGWSVADVARNFDPPLRVGQCKIWLDPDKTPRACATWALVDEETHAGLLGNGITPPPEKWASGKNLWLIDIIAPFGKISYYSRELERRYFHDKQIAHAIRRNPDGGIRRYVTLSRARNATSNEMQSIKTSPD